MAMACALSGLDDLYRTKVSILRDDVLLLELKNKRLEQYKEEFVKLQAENTKLASALARTQKRRFNQCDTCLEKRRAAELKSFKARIRKVRKQSAVGSKLNQNLVCYLEKLRQFVPFV